MIARAAAAAAAADRLLEEVLAWPGATGGLGLAAPRTSGVPGALELSGASPGAWVKVQNK
jgi:hypothetical protein